MDLNELMKMLKLKSIMPKYISKSQVLSAFKSANTDHSNSNSTDTNQHEMDFMEFLDCMQMIHQQYKNMKEDLDDPVSYWEDEASIHPKQRYHAFDFVSHQNGCTYQLMWSGIA